MIAALVDFMQRLVHSQLILLSIFYLRLSILFFKVFPCSLMPDPTAPLDSTAAQTESLILDADGQTRCYTGEHAGAVAGVVILLCVYTIGLPLGCFTLLMRAFTDEHTTGTLGWLRQRVGCFRDKYARRSIPRSRVLGASEMELASPSGVSGGRQLTSAWTGASSPSAAAVSKYDVTEEHGPVPSQSVRVAATSSSSKQASSATAAAAAAALVRHEREATYGFLFLSYRESAFMTGELLMLSSCALAAINVFATDGSGSSQLGLFLFGLVWTINTLLTAYYLPYPTLVNNGKNLLVGLASLGHAVVMLGLQQDSATSGYFVALLVLFGLMAVGIFFRQGWLLKHKPQWSQAFEQRKEGKLVNESEEEEEPPVVKPLRVTLSPSFKEAAAAAAAAAGSDPPIGSSGDGGTESVAAVPPRPSRTSLSVAAQRGDEHPPAAGTDRLLAETQTSPPPAVRNEQKATNDHTPL
jgi:hypothetical protein